jgi:hypothetical protein
MKEKKTELEKIILEDGSLKEDQEKRMHFKSLAVIYSQDLVANLDLTSIDLDEKYNTNDPVSWRKFLNHSSVKKFVDGFLNERAEKAAMKNISEGTNTKASDSLKIKQMVDNKMDKEDNSKIVVFFLPQKKYKYENNNNT